MFGRRSPAEAFGCYRSQQIRSPLRRVSLMSRVTRLFPVFTVPDLDDARAYYKEKLGFVIS